jgi:DNA-binding MarR family transcriptional regulator
MPDQDRVITLIALLRRTARAMTEEITERLEASGFPDSPPRHHPVFENIDAHGTRLTVLAARAGLTHQAMGEVVTELERRGMVERVPDPSDGRARLVCLTPAGREVVRAAIRAIDGIEEAWRERWRRAGLQGDIRAPLEVALRDEGLI